VTLSVLQLGIPVDRGNPRSNIEAAVIMRLEALTRRRGRYLEAVEHYNGEITAQRAMEQVMLELLGRAPAILVVTDTSAARERALNRRRMEETIQLSLLCVSAHRRSTASRKVGDVVSIQDPTADPGINQILWDARQLLLRGRLVVGARRLRHISDNAVIEEKELTGWRSLYEFVVQVVEAPVASHGPIEIVEHRHNLVEPEAKAVNPTVIGHAVAAIVEAIF
jgi:hypothetical protein